MKILRAGRANPDSTHATRCVCTRRRPRRDAATATQAPPPPASVCTQSTRGTRWLATVLEHGGAAPKSNVAPLKYRVSARRRAVGAEEADRNALVASE
eukprot:6524062-Prymnesium_polylepis.1